MGETDFSRREILRRTGDASQLLGVKEYVLTGGRSGGVRAIDAKNGSGLELTVLPDRGMDIAWLSCGGRNFSYIGKPGGVAPEYYDGSGVEWLRGFTAGFLTTCGLRNVGNPCEEGGEVFGLHGRAANAPAEAVSAEVEWPKAAVGLGPSPALRMSGRMREAPGPRRRHPAEGRVDAALPPGLVQGRGASGALRRTGLLPRAAL